MNTRDVKSAAVGAAIGAGALLGGSWIWTATTHVAAAGALEDAKRKGGSEEGAAGAAASETEAHDPLLAANANLADSVLQYKRRLEALAAEKKALEGRLAEAQQKLAVAQGDGEGPRSEFDLSPDDWKELAKQGSVRAHVPCLNPPKSGLLAADLQKDGFSPADLPAIRAALGSSRKRMWGVIRPLCVQALQGDAALADRLGPLTCWGMVQEMARENGEDLEEEIRQVAEVRAGLRAAPGDGEGPVMTLWLALTAQAGMVEQELARSIGPEDAHRFVYGGGGCWNDAKWDVGPREEP
jgi:hypothetical protein